MSIDTCADFHGARARALSGAIEARQNWEAALLNSSTQDAAEVPSGQPSSIEDTALTDTGVDFDGAHAHSGGIDARQNWETALLISSTQDAAEVPSGQPPMGDTALMVDTSADTGVDLDGPRAHPGGIDARQFWQKSLAYLSDEYDAEVPPSRPAIPTSSASEYSYQSLEPTPEPTPPPELNREDSSAESPVRLGRSRRRHFNRNHDLPPPQNEPVDLSDLWDLGTKDRDHEPPPEVYYNSHEEALAGVREWGKRHGVLFTIRKWYKGGRYKQLLVCNRSGNVEDRRGKAGPRKRVGASTSKCECPMAFYLAAVDKKDLKNCQWRVVHQLDRKSIIHNHPPVKDPYHIASYRRDTRTKDMREKVADICDRARSATHALQLVREAFPGTVWTRRDVQNEYGVFRRQQLGNKSKPEKVIEELQSEGYRFRYVKFPPFAYPVCIYPSRFPGKSSLRSGAFPIRKAVIGESG